MSFRHFPTYDKSSRLFSLLPQIRARNAQVRLWIISMLVLAVAFASVPVPAGAQTETTGQISGQVTDCTGQPLPGAQIRVQGTTLGTLTGTDGAYLLGNVPEGSQTVTAALLGYDTEEALVNVVGGQTTTQDFTLGNCITVTNTGDVGENSLREAINLANETEDTNTIIFDIDGTGPHTITPASPLPTIIHPVIIDGYTQPGASPNAIADKMATDAVLMIELDGSILADERVTADGLHITAGQSTVRGLVINGFTGFGILLETNGGNTISGNFIGTDVTGGRAISNEFGGINIFNVPGNAIGGPLPADRNLVSGNSASSGIQIASPGATGNLVQGNLVGTNAAGTGALANGTGVSVNRASSNVVGVIDGSGRNLVSGNRGGGIVVSGDGSTNNTVAGNFVGTNSFGTSAIPNNVGVVISNQGSSNTIGGLSEGAGNVISGNRRSGVEVLGSGTFDNLVLGNFIGTDTLGTGAIANGVGMLIDDANNTTIGGDARGAGNVISGNIGSGVEVRGGASGVSIQGNHIGVNAAGNTAVPNGDGIQIINSAEILIGGKVAAARNIISGNIGNGVALLGTARSLQVAGNYIGTDIRGGAAVANGDNGIAVLDTVAAVSIGGSAEGRNVISGNGDDGIEIAAAGSAVVSHNYIGTDVGGSADLGNGAAGVRIENASDNVIGGVGAGNVISGNGGEGIYVLNSSGVAILGNWIGTDQSGTLPVGNTLAGVALDASPNSVIGGYFDESGVATTEPGAGNVISANGSFGISIAGTAATGNTVFGNRIGSYGPDVESLANTVSGIQIAAGAFNQIGGPTDLERNVISGNREAAIVLITDAHDNSIINNYIGTDDAGLVAIPNLHGIDIIGAYANSIENNLISGNTAQGIAISGQASRANVIVNNRIGVAANGFSPLGNGSNGVVFHPDSGGPSNNAVGPGNTIAYNGQHGVSIGDGTGNSVLSNAIFANVGLGIDIAGSGDLPNENDPADTDQGPNGAQNFPDLEVPLFGNGSIMVSGSLTSAASADFTIEFFANASCDPSGHGEGQTFLGSLQVATDGAGSVSFSEVIHLEDDIAPILTATATDATGNTSEFSECPVPEIAVQDGHVHDIFASGISQPQGLAMDGLGNLIVAASGSGEILRIEPSGIVQVVLDGLVRPIDVAVNSGGTLYVSDLALDAVYAIPLSSLGNDPVNINDLGIAPLVSGLGGPTHLELGADETLYVSVVEMSNDRVVRVVLDGVEPDVIDVVTFAENVNPQGLAFESGDLYIAYQFPGEVRLLAAGTEGVPDGSALDGVLTGLNNPGGIDFGVDGKLYVATAHEVALNEGSSGWVPFVSGLSGGRFNSLLYDPSGVLYVSDRAAGRIIRVAAPKQQMLPSNHFAFSINEQGNPNISDGTDFTAVTSAIQTWADVPTSSFAYTYEGTSPLNLASATDGVNLVTFTDDEFLFPNGVLAVAAKTIIVGDSPEEAHIVDADIVYNPFYVNHPVTTLRLGTTTVAGAYDIQSIATHEFGHVLGLVHSGVPDATMFFVLQEDIEAQTLTRDDAGWLSYLYPGEDFGSLGAIEGLIENGENLGNPVAGALVLAQDENTGELVHAYSDLNGNYHIPGLPSGTYRVFAQPLDGDVGGYPLTPAHISAYLKTVTTKTDYPNEFFNDDRESADPDIDAPTDFASVTVSSTASGIDFVTNQDLTPPTITGVSPVDGATNVDVAGDILVGFSEPIVPATFTSAFSLDGPEGPVGGSVLFLDDDQTALVSLSSDLAHETTYTISIAAAVEDRKGNVLRSRFSASFQTEPPDETAPTVVETSPDDLKTDVFITSDITIVFSEMMNAATVNETSVLLSDGTNTVLGELSMSLNNTVATLDPDGSLAEGTTYTLTLTTDIQDVSGNALAPYPTTFETVAEAAPVITNFGPAGDATGVTTATPILVDFSEPINTSTIDETTFVLSHGGTAVEGTFEFLNQNARVIFRPAGDLAPSTTYQVALTSGIFDISPTPLNFAGFTWQFTTASDVTAPTITSVSPPSAAVGQIVTINGSGFDPDPALNVVSYNGAIAVVSSATLTSLTTIVPSDATTGPLTVTVEGTESNAFSFGLVVPSEDVDNAVIATTSTEGGTTHAAISPDGAFAYATNSLDDNVSIIDLVNLTTITPAISVGDQPLKIAINAHGTLAYVTNFLSHTVSVIDVDPESGTFNEVIDTIPVGLNPFGVAITPSSDRVYVSEFTSRGVSVIDADPTSGAFNHVVARTSTEGGSKDVAISPDGTLAFIATTEGIEVIDVNPASTAYNDVIAKTSVEGGTNDVAISPDGAFAIVTANDGEILIIDAVPSSSTAYQVVAKTSTEGGTKETAISPDGTLVYATNFDDGTVTVYEVELSSGAAPSGVKVVDGGAEGITGTTVVLTEVDEIEVGTNPQGIVIDPLTRTAVVANTGSNNVSIIRLTSASSDDLLLALLNRIKELVESGELSHGHGTALTASIATARFHLSRGREKQGKKSIEVFIQKVNQLVAEGHLNPLTGDELISLANLAIDRIGSGSNKSVVEGDPAIDELPAEFALKPNYPNPFNPTTTIEYDIPGGLDGPLHVRLEVYNVLGQRVAVLVNEEQTAGRHQAVWDGRTTIGAEAASGVYLFRIEMGSFRDVRKMTLLR